MRTKRRKTVGGEIVCCCHRVSWWYDIEGVPYSDDMEARFEEEAEERARHCIADDCCSGELNCLWIDDRGREHEVRGWWSIENGGAS